MSCTHKMANVGLVKRSDMERIEAKVRAIVQQLSIFQEQKQRIEQG